MSLSNKSLLLLCDDAALAKSVAEALQPVVKSLTVTTSPADAIKRAMNQAYDCFILRTGKPSMNDPTHLFNWTQMQKTQKAIPWLVLGKDIEDEQIVITHNHVKFTDKPDDLAGMLTILNGMFFSTTEDGAEQKKKVDASFMIPLIGAVVDVIKSMAQIELKRGTPYLRQPNESARAIGDISGIIAMNSDRFVGSMAICFQKSLVLKIYENMLGETVKEVNDDVKDAVSEMTNIIFGNAKRDLNAAGHTISPALPSVVTGPGHEIRHAVTGHCFCIPFDCADGRLMVECVISMKQ
ncbi:MAG: chemotaxis protein CheX [Bdellovibrionales bacterium]|nr:chemotaxis protein CheX [Bdellovibrionales bacterium]